MDITVRQSDQLYVQEIDMDFVSLTDAEACLNELLDWVKAAIEISR